MTEGALDLSGKRALVVGGSSGIGLGIARRLAAAGASTEVTGTRSGIDAYEHGDLLRSFPYHQLDVSTLSAFRGLLPACDGLDVLVYSAGTVAYRRQEYDMDTFARVVAVNLTGAMAACTRFHEALRAVAGSVVLVGSTSSFIATPGQPAYGASKGGLVTLIRSLARAWATDGIRVNGVAPGFVDTKLTAATRDDDDAYEATLQRIPLRRWGRPEEMGDATLFLASNMASYITGQMLLVDGGITLM